MTYAELRADGVCTSCKQVKTSAARCTDCRQRRANQRTNWHKATRHHAITARDCENWNVCCQSAGRHRRGCR